MGAPLCEYMRGLYNDEVEVRLTRDFDIQQYELSRGDWTGTHRHALVRWRADRAGVRFVCHQGMRGGVNEGSSISTMNAV